jgi:hypothetical protein
VHGEIAARRRTLIALLLAAILGVLAGCSESSPTDPPPVRERASSTPPAVTDPVAAFAPLVRIHPRERWFPISTRRFLSNAGLEWGGGPCESEIDVSASASSSDMESQPVPPLDVSRLGRKPGYRIRPLRANCMGRRPGIYSTSMRTAPFDGTDRPAGLHADEGFVLDILSDAQPGRRRLDGDGALVGVPAYYARERATVAGRSGLRLSYWLLYGHGARPAPAHGGVLAHHEGDWERVDVIVRPTATGRSSRPRYAPVAVRYHSDERVLRVAWKDVEVAGARATHPVADTAEETHTPRPAARCGGCIDWPTWHDLRDVRLEPWYGYGGAWGATRRPAVAASPPGPSPFELARPPGERTPKRARTHATSSVLGSLDGQSLEGAWRCLEEAGRARRCCVSARWC